jgi:hypothetical protein
VLKISQAQWESMSAAAEERFVERVRQFLESDYPEAAGFDEESGCRNARAAIAKAKQFGLVSQAGVLKYISMTLDYFLHEPAEYAWALELLSDPDISEEHKILGLEHRLYGAPLWG